MNDFSPSHSGRMLSWVVRLRRLVIGLALLSLGMPLAAQVVTTLADNVASPPAGSLRAALNTANASGSAAAITFNISGGGTINLAGALPVLRNPNGISIDGANGGQGAIVIDGGSSSATTGDRIFFLGVRGSDSSGLTATPGANWSISNLTLQDGNARGGAGGTGSSINGGWSGGGGGAGLGGAIFVNEGNATLSNVQLLNNRATGGNGGILSAAVAEGGSGGGGGMGGNGGNGGSFNAGGGGGLGLGANGGVGSGGAGSAGLLAGASAGGAGSGTGFGAGGANGGGGGGSNANQNGGGGGPGGEAGTTTGLPGGAGKGGNGAYGGGGGAAGGNNTQVGGNGGYGGGGGGAGAGDGGNGGFGGGGGGGAGSPIGAGGFGAGSGAGGYQGGGGGAALGAAVFVRQGATLTLNGGGLSGGLVTGGSAGPGASSGLGIGTAAFLAGPMTWSVASGQTVTLAFGSNLSGGSDALVSGGLTKSGPGTLVLNSNNNYVGPTAVSAGQLQVNANLLGTGAVSVSSGATLAGIGTLSGATSVASGGTLAPGQGAPGRLNTANVVFAAGANFAAEITGATVATQYDQLDVTGTINLGGATLALSGAHVPTTGPSFVLIDNDASDAVTGTFAGLAQGSTLIFNGVTLSISYNGGDGNDVVLSAVVVDPCAAFVFPYTLAGADNTARLANLRQAIQCANSNGAGSDTINLNGQTVDLPASAPFADYSGQTALPQITSAINIRNGTLFHDLSMGGFLFRTFSIGASGTLNVQNMELFGGSAPTPGGAFHNSGTLNVTNSTMHGYDTSNRGGVLYNGSGASANFVNSLFYNNHAVFAHAMDNVGTVSIVNSTFDKHVSVGGFGAILEGTGYTVRNSILWNPGSGPTQISTGNTVSDSIVKGGYSGGTNILNTSPLFVDEGGNDFRIQLTSPAVNVGVNTYVPADTTDVDGDSNTAELRPDLDLNPRVVAGTVDMGAYERQDALPPDPCAAYVFPYTLSGVDNTARVANLRQAIQCANANGSADTIDLNGQTVTMADSFADYSGATSLPQITSNISLQNGTLTRSGVSLFRIVSVSAAGSLTLRGTTVSNGGGSGYASLGAGIHNLGTTTVVNTNIVSNTGNLAVAIYSNNTLRVVNSTIAANFASSYSAILEMSGTATIANTVISGNRSTTSDNISINSGTLTVSNSTVAYNYTAVSANNASGAFYKFPSATLIVQNSIIWGNRNSNNSSDQIEVSSGSPTVSNSIIEGGIFGSINADPLFVTPIAVLSTPTTAGDFQLNNFSPAIDAGANANVPVDTFDVDGDTNTAEEAPDRALAARRYNDTGVTDTGSGTAPIVDLGAYERQTNSDPCAAISFPYTMTGNTPVELRQAITCANANGTADVINLNGQTITLTDSFANYSGNTGLPQITTSITVRNGTITRSGANEFRFFNVSNTGNLTVRDLTLTNGGGVAYANNGGTIISVGTASTLTVVNTTISGSRTDDLFNGSAISSNAIFTIVNSSVVGGGFGRGAIASGNGPVLIQNTLVAGNSGPTTINGAGGVYFGNVSSATIENSTIVGNYTDSTPATQPGGVFASGGTVNLTIRNSIIWGNRNIGNTAPQVVNTTAGTNTVTSSLIEGGTFGALNSDPLFLTPITASATPTTAGNFRLSDLSPAVDAGANANVPVDSFDVDGDANTAEEAPDRALAARRYNDTGVTDTGSGTAPIVDLGAYEKQTNSAPPVPAVSISLPAPGSVSEDGASNLIYTVTRNPSLATATTVNITTAGTATSGGDYIGGVATVVIPANASTATITLDPSVDSIVEPNETVILTVAAGSGYTVGAPASATGTILNDDNAALTIADVSQSESGTFTFSVVLNAATSAAFGVDWTLAQGTTVAADYVGSVLPTGGTLNFTGTAGETRSFTVPVFDDALVESSETFTIGLTNFATAGGFTVNISDNATGTILDNDVADFTVTTTPTSITVVDSSSNGDTLAATEPVLNNLRLDAPGRTFSVDGGALISGNSGNLALAGVTSIALNATGGTSVATGAIFNIGASTFTSVSPITLAGGTLKTTGATAVVNAPAVLSNNSDVVGTMTLAGPISGDFTLRTFGAGSYRFTSTANTFARLQISAGTVILGDNNTLPPQIDIFNSASLNLNGFSQSIDFYASSGTTQNTGAAATLTMGVAGSSSTFGSANYAGSISGPINLIIATAAGQTLSSNSSSYAGTTDVLGTLTVTGDSALGAVGSGNGTTVAATGALDFRNVLYADNEAITVNGGTLRTSSGTSVFPGTIALQTSAASIVLSDPASSLTLDGVVSGSQGFLKSGTGTLVLTQANTFIGPLTVGAGGLVITGSTAAASAVSINNGSLSGTGTIGGPLAVSNVGNLSPGLSASTGILHTANVALASGSNFLVNINGSTADTQYDQLDVNGTIDLTGADLFLVGAYAPAAGQSFMLIDNDGSDPVTGTFTGLPSNGTLTFNGVVLAIRYDGGDGNDVVLTAVPVVSIDVAPASVTEDGVTNLVYTVTRSASLPMATVVNITTAGSATPGGDYTGVLATATIPASATTTTISIDPAADGTVEANETVILTIAAGSGYTVGTPSSATGTILNDDTAAIIVSPTAGLVTTEAGGTATFTVVLNSQPSADVSIGLSSSDTTEGTVAPTSLLFTSGNWNVAQTVTVTGADDVIVDGAVAYSIVTAAATSADSNYNGVDPANVGVSNSDNDTAGITVSPTSGLVTTEAGGTATFTVVLNSQPSADVSIGLSSSDTTEGNVAPTSLLFTTSNWNVAQTVTVTGIDDVIVDGAVAYTIASAAATSSDSNYNGVNASDVSVSNSDNDSAAVVVVQSGGTTAVAEGAATDSYTVVLSSQPSNDVSIALTGSQVTTSPSSLTFTSVNWATAQTVTLTAIDDAIDEATPHAGSVSSVVTSSDANYNGASIAPINVSITDNDTADITVTPTSGLTTTEAGGTANFSVVLTSQPTGNVTIGLSSSDTTEGTVAPISLSFTAGNWNVAQNVTVTGVDDVIVDGAIAYSIVTAPATSSDSNYSGFNASDVSASNSDNDSAGITVVQSGGTTAVTEGGATDSYTVVLSSQPSADVTIALIGSEVTTAPTGLTFTPVNWASAQTVTVTAIDDAIDEATPHAGSVSSVVTSSDANYNGSSLAPINVSITDNDTAGISVTPTSGLSTTEAGGTANFSVVLTSQPTGNVTIGLSSSDTTEGTVAPISLSFTAGNWNVAQNVTVTGVDDVIVDGSVAYSIVTAAATSSDSNYNGVNASDVSVSNGDNDSAAVIVAQSGGTTVVTEGGAADTYTMALSSQPSSDVTIALSGSQVTTSPSSLTFTSVNWATAQTVTVTAIDDAIDEATPHAGSVSSVVTSSDANYNGSSLAPINVSITDNDTAGISVTPTSGLSTTEAGGTANFSLVLTSQPTGNVTIGLSSSDTTEGTVAPTSLSFTAGNWNVAQTVTVTGVDDLIVDGAVAYNILTAPATSGDANYSALNASDVSVSNSDNDTASITVVQSGGTTTVTEGGATDSYTVVLSSQPTSDVNIALTGTEVTTSPTSLVFTSANWATAQTVTVTAIDDAIDEATPHAGSVTSAVTSSDANYNGSSVAPISVNIADNDTAGISVTPTSGLTTTEAGGTASFSVVLTSQPTGNVSIGLSSSDATEASVAPTALTFTAANWNIAQAVTVTGVDDGIVDGAIAYGIITAPATSSDASYNGVNPSDVSASNSDNDNAGVTVVESGGTTAVTEGGATDTYTVVLTSQPTANVAVILGVGAQVSLSPSNLTFTPANWNVAQTVTVTATDDAVVEGPHNAAITHSTSSTDPNYSAIPVAGINVAITDNDSAVVNFAPASVSQLEGSSPMVFTVTLSAPVASGVTLTLNSANGTAGAADFTPITNATVSFAASSTTAQTVNVVVNNDALDENDETFSLTLTNLVATGDVSIGAASAAATILDDDATPTLSISNQSQPEGNAGTSLMTFTVNLSAVSGRDVSFSRATVDGTATVANNDYVALVPQTLSILAGSTSLTIPVTINGDSTFEGNESFTLALTGISNATPASISGTGTLEEDDQQPTTTTITADTPDPTVVGQPYTVSVNVAAQTLAPTGTVTITDGSASCGPVSLAAATSPNSTASCAITSTSAGAKTLIASYTAATTAFGNSASVGTPHQVNAASTAISVVGPVRSRINQPTTFTFALSVNAPGAGAPAGTVTLTSGTASCNVTVPTATPSCALSFNTLGPRTITAAFAPSDANFSSSSSSGPGNAQTLVYALSDLAVTKTDAVGTYVPGDLLVYTVTVRNVGPDAAANIRVRDNIPAGLTDVVWTCDDSGGVVCPAASGSGNLDLTINAFPVGGLLNYTFFGNVAGTPAQIVNTALVDLPVDTTIEDPSMGNNSASDTDLIDYLLRNGFEDPQVNAPSGSVRLSATRSASEEAAVVVAIDDANGIGARVYARSFDGAVQYALATRSAGVLRLGAWRSDPGAATLHWTARQTPAGWVLETAEIR